MSEIVWIPYTSVKEDSYLEGERWKTNTKEYPGKNLEFSKKVCITLYYFNPDHSLRSGKDKKILLGGQLYPVTNQIPLLRSIDQDEVCH